MHWPHLHTVNGILMVIADVIANCKSCLLDRFLGRRVAARKPYRADRNFASYAMNSARLSICIRIPSKGRVAGVMGRMGCSRVSVCLRCAMKNPPHN